MQANTSEETASFHFPATGIKVTEDALLLAIDDASLPVKQNVYLDITKPQIRPEPVLTPSPRKSAAPDNLAAHFYGTVLHDEGRFRMWYYACHWGRNPDWNAAHASQLAKWKLPLFQGPLCYAESDDGIHWTKPNLYQLQFKGSHENNAFDLPHTLVSAATVIKDMKEPDPARRYKMVYEFFPEFSNPPLKGIDGFMPTCALAVSADGIKWKVVGTPYPQEFIEQSSFYQHDGKYIINSQHIETQVPSEGGGPAGRQGYARFSYDFDHWIPGQVESFTLTEPLDPKARGMNKPYDQVHLGVGAASFGTVCVGLYGMWHDTDAVDKFAKVSCDFGLVVSNDGLHFREPVKGHVYISQRESPATPAPGKKYNTNLCQANGILNVGDETRIYHGRWLNCGYPDGVENYRAEVALATLPRDRWGALCIAAGRKTGAVWSAPVTLPLGPWELFVNAEGAKGIKVALVDEQFAPLAEFSGANSGTTTAAEGLDCAIRWKADVAALAGKTVRLHIQLQASEKVQPKLYAASLRTRRAH